MNSAISNLVRAVRQPAVDTTTVVPRDRAARRNSERRGRFAEWIAAACLIAKGYRILARRARTPYGEIDIVAVRGTRVAFVEVKLRASLAAAQTSVGRRQAGRIARAAEHWAWRHPRYRNYRIGLDSIYLANGVLPRHVSDNLQPF